MLSILKRLTVYTAAGLAASMFLHTGDATSALIAISAVVVVGH